MSQIKRIIVIDDYDYLSKAMVNQIPHDAEAIKKHLEIEDDFEIQASAFSSLKAAENSLKVHDVDLIILDLDLDDGKSPIENLAEIAEIKKRTLSTAAVALYSGMKFHKPEGIQFLRVAFGAYSFSGVIPKSTPSKRVHESLARLLSNEEWYPPDLLKKLAEPSSLRNEPRMGLTEREWDVALLLSEGLPNRIIGVRLGLTEDSVKQLVGSILDKLHLPNRTRVAIEVYKNQSSNRG